MKDLKRIAKRLTGVGLLAVSAFLVLLMVLNCCVSPHKDGYHPSGRTHSLIQPYPGLPAEHLFNSGDRKALEEIPGIGGVLSERIVQWREEVGPFIFAEDIMLVKGIGEKRYEDALAYIAQSEATPTDLERE